MRIKERDYYKINNEIILFRVIVDLENEMKV